MTKKELEDSLRYQQEENQKLRDKIEDLDKRVPLIRSEVQKMIDEAINSHKWEHHAARDDY